MKLLFDQILSHRLVRALAEIYPECGHVRNVGLKEASDTDVWTHALKNGYVIVSKDSDFHQRSLLMEFPPKVIWVRLGNCSTQAVELLLRVHAEDLKDFEADETATFLILT